MVDRTVLFQSLVFNDRFINALFIIAVISIIIRFVLCNEQQSCIWDNFAGQRDKETEINEGQIRLIDTYRAIEVDRKREGVK